MNERYIEALEQYEFETVSVRKGRGSWICDTSQGCRLLKEYRGTVRRLEFEDAVLGTLDTRTSLRVDRYVRNKEGSLLTIAGDGSRYVLKEWFSDRECNIRDSYEIRQAISRLAMLHSQLRQVEFKEEWMMGSICGETLADELFRHTREMQRARNYIRDKRRKTEFERCVIGNFTPFYEQAQEAQQGMKHLWAEEKDQELWAAELSGASVRRLPGTGGSSPFSCLCHGDLDQHHVLIGTGYTAIVDYNRMHLGIQALDLYRLMRKVMEKHGWNTELGLSMLDSYERVRPMDKKERSSLYYMFLYPEKYWKQLNFYYNANKAWIPGRNIEKLKGLEEQQPARARFLEKLEQECH